MEEGRKFEIMKLLRVSLIIDYAWMKINRFYCLKIMMIKLSLQIFKMAEVWIQYESKSRGVGRSQGRRRHNGSNFFFFFINHDQKKSGSN